MNEQVYLYFKNIENLNLSIIERNQSLNAIVNFLDIEYLVNGGHKIIESVQQDIISELELKKNSIYQMNKTLICTEVLV